MLKKLSAVFLSALLLVGCSSGSSKSNTDYEKTTTDYIELSQKGKWDEAEKLASLDMSNPFKDEVKYEKTSTEFRKDIKKKIGEDKYKEFEKKLDKEIGASKIVKKFKINKTEEDEKSNLAVVKVTATMLSSEKVYDKTAEIIEELDSQVSDLVDKYIEEDQENYDYDAYESRANAEVYTDEALNKIIDSIKGCYTEQVMKFSFNTENGKLNFVTLEN